MHKRYSIVNTRNDIANLNSLNSFLAKRGENCRSSYEAKHRVAAHGHCSTCKCTAYHTGDHSVGSTLNGTLYGTLTHTTERAFNRTGFLIAFDRALYTTNNCTGGCPNRSTYCTRSSACCSRCCGYRCRDRRNYNNYSHRLDELLPERRVSLVISICYGVIVAISIKVQTVDVVHRVFKNTGRIRVDKSANLGIVVTAIEIIDSGFYIVVVTTISYRVNITDIIIGIIIDRKYLTPCIVCVTCYLKTRRGVDFGNVVLQVLAEVVVGSVVFKSNDSASAVVIGERLCTVALTKDLVTVKYINSIGMCKLYHIQCKLSRKNSALGGIPRNSFKCGEWLFEFMLSDKAICNQEVCNNNCQ